MPTGWCFKSDGTVTFNDTEVIVNAVPVGLSGYSGARGTSGYSGTSGASGTSGYSGTSGFSGYSGV